MLRRCLAAICVAAMTIAGIVPAALAAGPSRNYLALPDTIVLGPGEACDFAVQVDFLVNREYGVTFTDEAGNPVRQLIAGTLIVRLTNLSSGTSIVVDISGPGKYVFHEDGSWTQILRGNSIPLVPGEFYLTTGTVVQEYDAGGNLLSTSRATGTETDLCPSLA